MVRVTRMTMEEKVQYLLDRSEIQERIAIYGLGQDYHQPGFKNQDSYNEWSEVFSDDVQIDVSDVVPETTLNLTQYVEMMRGKDGRGGGLDTDFRVWAHLEHPVKIRIEGDDAESVSLHIHTHETKDSTGSTAAVGYWFDRWKRMPNGWRIVERRVKQLFFNTAQLIETPGMMGGGGHPFQVKEDRFP